MDNYIAVLKKYSDFESNSTRKEYWMFVLFNIVFSSITALISPNASAFYYLFVFIPALAVTVRRLHDVGKSGWMMLIVFIPIIGWIWLLVLLLQEGNSDEIELSESVFPKDNVIKPKTEYTMNSDDIKEEFSNIEANKEVLSKEEMPKENTTKEVFSNDESLYDNDADFIEYAGNDGVIKTMKKSQASKFPQSHPARIAADKTL
jgi:uncharacterized membrane protein YhaH (DUF805 family)